MLTTQTILPVDEAGIPSGLKARRSWVLWEVEERNGKLTKVPYQVNMRKAKVNDPASWASFDEVWDLYTDGKAAGIGFVFHKDGGLVGVDLDGCISEEGTLHPRAAEVVELLNSYTELSPSGRGLHVIVKGTLAQGRRNGPLEIYPHGRFFTVTGNRWGEVAEVRDAQAELERLVAGMAGPKPKPSSCEHRGSYPYLGNEELVEKAKTARNGEKFVALWAGDISGYPSPSEADCALLSMLLFWTRGDADRAEVLFSQSGLARAKWERPDYRRRTIAAALQCVGEGARA